MSLPDMRYFTLPQVAARWQVDEGTVRYHIKHDELQACCWLDRREVMIVGPEEEVKKSSRKPVRFEGYVGLHARDCRKIFRCGSYSITECLHLEESEVSIVIPSGNSDALIAQDNLYISLTERNRFELAHDLMMEEREPCKAIYLGEAMPLMQLQEEATSFEHRKQLKVDLETGRYCFAGDSISLGPAQLAILHKLVEAHKNDDRIHGQTALHSCGCQSTRMHDLFKHKPHWKQFVQSSPQGYYWIKPEIEVVVLAGVLG